MEFEKCLNHISICINSHLLQIIKNMQSKEIKKRQNKNLLPKTYEEFLASKKKPATNTNLVSFEKGKKNSGRRDTVPFGERTTAGLQSKPQQGESSDDDRAESKFIQIEEKMIYSDYSKIRQEMSQARFDAIKGKICETLQKATLDSLVQPIDVCKITKDLDIISLESLAQLEQQFAKPKQQRDCHLIDRILNTNKFFLIFNKEKRFRIYDEGELIILPKDTDVYKQGSEGDEMFVIIKGSVHILQTKQTSYNEKLVLQFTSLYEGAHFGETSMGFEDGNTRQRRQNTIRTSNKTYMLKMHHNFYKELITNSIQDDFEKKMMLVSSIDILKQQTKLFITPLVSGLTRTKYKYGQAIIRKGEPVNKFYILAEGELQVLLQERARRKISMGLEGREKNFVYKEFSKEKRIKTANAFANTFYYPKEQYEKCLLYGNKKLVGDQVEFTDHLVFKELKPVIFFGGRAFFTEFFIGQKQKNFPTEQFQLQSRLNVVCNSLKAVLYELDQKKFNSLPDSLQNVILEGLAKTLEFDSADISLKVNEKRKWRDFSAKLVDGILREKKMKLRT